MSARFSIFINMLRAFSLVVISVTILLLGEIGYAQSGFYMTVPCNKHIPDQRKILSGRKSVCLANNAIVGISEVVKVSDVTEIKNPNSFFFDIEISDKGYKVLKDLTARIPSANLVLMHDNEMVFILDTKTKEFHKTIRIHRSTDYILFKVLHHKLKEAVENSAK